MSDKAASRLGCFLTIDQPPSQGAPQYATPTSFEATGAGAVDGSTTVSSTLAVTTTSDHQPCGWLVEESDDTVNANLRRRVLDYVDGTGTLTHDILDAQSQSGDGGNLIVPTHPYWSEDTGGSAAQIQDATRNEVDDAWNGTAEEGGPYIEVIRADNPTKTTLKGPISDFTQAGGIAAVDLGAASAVTDVYEAWQCLEWLDQTPLELALEMIERDAPMGTFNTPGSAVGRRSASGQKKIAMVGPGRGRAGKPSALHRLLKCALTDRGNAGDLTGHLGGSVSSVVFDAGAITKGDLYCTTEGDVFLAGSAASPCTPYPNLRVAAADGTTIRHLRTYHPATALPGHFAVKQYRGRGLLEYIWGCVAKWSFAFAANRFFEATLDIEGCDWLQLIQDNAGAISRAWRARRPTVGAVKPTGGRVVLDGVAMRLKSGSINLGLSYALEESEGSPNGVLGYRLADCRPTGSFVGVVDTPAANGRVFSQRDSGRELSGLLVQIGTRPGFPGVFAFYGHRVQVTGCKVSDDGGKQIVEASWKLNDHDTDTSGLPTCALGIG